MTPEQRDAILAEVKGGNKIAAIKLCREATGMDLAGAKDWVEKLETSPDAPLTKAGAAEIGALSQVADLLFAGKKISAIKLYREQVKPGSGLAEAKDAVEQLEAGLRAQHPAKFTAPAKKPGCTAVLALLAVLVVVVVWIRS